MQRKMTSREVVAEFNRQWAERVRQCPAYANDKPAARQFFSVLVDDLSRDGRISDRVADAVVYPARFD